MFDSLCAFDSVQRVCWCILVHNEKILAINKNYCKSRTHWKHAC